jgi:hypothetical protein
MESQGERVRVRRESRQDDRRRRRQRNGRGLRQTAERWNVTLERHSPFRRRKDDLQATAQHAEPGEQQAGKSRAPAELRERPLARYRDRSGHKWSARSLRSRHADSTTARALRPKPIRR